MSTFSAGGKESPTLMEKRQKQQVLDGTGSCSLNSACRWLSCKGRLPVDLRQQQHSEALWATMQPSLGTALLDPHGDGPRKGGLNKACLTPTSFANRIQQASLPSGKKNERKKKTANLKAAFWNIRTIIQDSEDRPQWCSVLVARELARLGTDIAALSEVCFVEQGSLMKDGAGYTQYTLFWSGKDKRRLYGVGFMIKTFINRKLQNLPVGHSDRIMSLRLPIQDNKFTTVFSVHAPTLQAETGVKEALYRDLHNILQQVDSKDKLLRRR